MRHGAQPTPPTSGLATTTTSDPGRARRSGRCSRASRPCGRRRLGSWPTLTPAPLALTADELALLGSSRIVSWLLTHRVEVEWPAELVRDVDARGSVRRVDPSGPDRPRAFSRDQLFRFDWRLAIGDDTLTEAEVDELARSQTGLLRLRDQWVFVDPNRIRHVLERRSRDLTPG